MSGSNTSTVVTTTTTDPLVEAEAKVNPTLLVLIDYLAVGILLGALYYGSLYLGKIDVQVVTVAIVSALSALGVYKAKG